MTHPSRPRARRGQRDQNRRHLSQNFLQDHRVLGHLAQVAVPDRVPLLVEVGAGDGRLTVELARRADRVVAHEIDPRLASRLRARCQSLDNVRWVLGDFLRTGPPNEPFVVVGNIPYAVTSPIVDWCRNAPRLTSATLVTQLEYARKRTGDFGRWSQVTVESWPWFDWTLGGRIGRQSFRPVPRVDSAILRLTRRPTPRLPPAERRDYQRLVAVGFSGVGGSLHASLRRAYPPRRVDAACQAAGLASGTVVAYVHPDQWLTLHRRIHQLA